MSMDLRTRASRREDGAIAVLVGILTVTLFVLAAIVIDIGLAKDIRRQSQNAADASALAAVNQLYPASGVCQQLNPNGSLNAPCFADAAKAAKDYAWSNFEVSAAEWSSCADSAHYYVPTGYSQCISFTDSSDATGIIATPTRVRVLMPRRNVSTGLGTLAGVSSIPVDSGARASLTGTTAVTCAVCFMGPIDAKKFKIQVDSAGIYANGDVEFQAAGAVWNGTGITVAGTTDRLDTTSPLTTGRAPLPDADPWIGKAGLPPSTTGATIQPANTNPCVNGPGVYGDWEFKNACTLPSGMYVITGAWTWKNVVVKTAAGGVTLYATCGTRTNPSVCVGSNAVGGSIDAKNGGIELTAPAATGFGIIYDKYNHAGLSLQGNGNVTVSGAIYAPNSVLDYNGNSDVRVVGGPVILGAMEGNGTTGIHVEGGKDATIPGSPSDPALDQ